MKVTWPEETEILTIMAQILIILSHSTCHSCIKLAQKTDQKHVLLQKV